MTQNPEIANQKVIDGLCVNYHDVGQGEPLLLIHGSGPGVSAWANWRLNMPVFAEHCRVIAPDMQGFGYSDPAPGQNYSMQSWVRQLVGLLDALELQQVTIVGNSFGGALALATAIAHPERVKALVLMGSVGVRFELTEGLDRVWGYEPSVEAMKGLLDIFAYSRELVTDELAELRYQASIREGVQENFSAMFPAPRQRWVDAMSSDPVAIAALQQPTLIIHGREDKVIPPANSQTLHELIRCSQLHSFGQCGHWTQIEHKDSFNRLVLDFLKANNAAMQQ